MRGEQMETAKTIDVNTKYFSNISHRERAIFEGGISMGALFHQFIGTPVSIKSAETLEKSMEQSLELQPCINSVTVKINNEKLEELNTEFEYVSLSGDMLDVTIISEFEGTLAKVRMQYQEDLKYPLMYIEQITD